MFRVIGSKNQVAAALLVTALAMTVGEAYSAPAHKSGVPLSHSGGPDSAGYRWIDSDTTGGPQFDWIDTTGFYRVPYLGDEGRINIPTFFEYPYYDSTYNYVCVSANGWLSAGWNPGGVGDSLPRRLPDTGLPNNIICPYWDNLAGGPGFGGGRLYYGYDSATVPRVTITWLNVNRVGTDTTDLLSFQVTIGADGTIVFQYADVSTGDTLHDFGRTASVGIENRAGTVGLQYLRGHPDSSVNWPCNQLRPGRAIRFWRSLPGIAELSGGFSERVLLELEPAVAKNSCTIRYGQPDRACATLEVHDVSGRNIMRMRVLGGAQRRLEELRPGLYYCTLSSATGGRQARKLIVVD